MHDMLTFLIDVCGVCLSVMRQNVHCTPGAMCAGSFGALYAACHVRRVIRCSLCQITLITCFYSFIFYFVILS